MIIVLVLFLPCAYEHDDEEHGWGLFRGKRMGFFVEMMGKTGEESSLRGWLASTLFSVLANATFLDPLWSRYKDLLSSLFFSSSSSLDEEE